MRHTVATSEARKRVGAGQQRRWELHMGTHSGRRRSTDELRKRIFQEAAALVAAELERPLTVEEVALRVATSPRQLQRACSEIVGLSFRAYVTRVRISRAADLLAASELPVREIAARVGYREPSQFTKAFKRAYGVTPSELRATRRGGRSTD